MTGLPREIRKWVRDEPLDVKTRVRFSNLADEIERIQKLADKAGMEERFNAIRDLCLAVDTETTEALQGSLADAVLAALGDPDLVP